MNKRKEMFGMYLPLFSVITVIAAALRCIATFLYYDSDSFHYSSVALIRSADITVAIAALIMITYMFTAKRDMRLIPNFTTPATYVPTGLVSLTLLFLAKEFLVKGRELRENAAIARSGIIELFIIYAVAILSVISVMHFVLTALDERAHSGERARFGLSTVILLALYSIYLYFDVSMPINAPAKITDQMAYMFAAIFFLYETRLSLGREKWRAYISFGFIAAMLTAYSSIPSIIIYIVNGTEISNSIYESVLTFALFIFITARILLTSDLINDETSKTASSLIRLAEAREAELAPEPIVITEAPTAEDEGQITISDIEADLPKEEEKEASDENTDAEGQTE